MVSSFSLLGHFWPHGLSTHRLPRTLTSCDGFADTWGQQETRRSPSVSVRDPFLSQLRILGKQLPSHQTEFERRKLGIWDWDFLCALGWNLSLKSQECCCEFSEGGSPSRGTWRALPLSGASSTAVLADKYPQHWTESRNSKPPLYQLECCKILFQFLLNFLAITWTSQTSTSLILSDRRLLFIRDNFLCMSSDASTVHSPAWGHFHRKRGLHMQMTIQCITYVPGVTSVTTI